MTAVKIALAVTLAAAVLVSVRAPAPHHAARFAELARLLAGALALYVVGAIAALRHQPSLAGVLYACGIVLCGLGAWLSRGRDDREPPGDSASSGPGRPPRDPADPRIDWPAFDRARARWLPRDPASAGPR